MRVSLVPSVEYIKEDELKGKIVVLIDVLRATTVITTALNNGAKEVIPTVEVEEALCLKGDNILIGGERKALRVQGFDLSNSPLEYKREIVEDKIIVISTTNGTKAIHHSLVADEIVIGSMISGKAVAEYIHDKGEDVVIVCAGTMGKFSLDDFICAGKIILECMNKGELQLEDFAATAYMAYRDNKGRILDYVKMASHYNYLMSIGLEEDVKYCFTEDITEIVPRVVKNHGDIVIRL